MRFLTPIRTSLLPLLCLWLSGCVPTPDLNAVADSAKANCESTDADLRMVSARMYPGRQCGACHTSGGQAGNLVWTAGGTVYNSPTSPCNSGFLDGVQVDILDAQSNVVQTLTTNRMGNFFTAESLGAGPWRARVSQGGKVKEMSTLQTTLDCGSCHYPALGQRPAGQAAGRIYLN